MTRTAATPTQEAVAGTATPTSQGHIAPTSKKLQMTSDSIMSQLEQLPFGVLIHICLHVDEPDSLHNLLSTCKHVFRLSRDPQLVSDWLVAHRRHNALVLSCSKGNTAATMRLLSACNSPIRPTPRSRQTPVMDSSSSSALGHATGAVGLVHGNGTCMMPSSNTMHYQQTDDMVKTAGGKQPGNRGCTHVDSYASRPLYVNHDDAEAALCAAAAAGHVDLLVQLMQWGIPAAGAASSGRPLIAAAASGQLAVVKALITGQLITIDDVRMGPGNDKGVSVNVEEKCGSEGACSNGSAYWAHSQGVQLPGYQLLRAVQGQAGGTSVRRQLFQQQQQRRRLNAAPVAAIAGNQALLAAAAAGHQQVVQLLLQAGAGTVAGKQDAMAGAAAAGYLDVVQLLAVPAGVHTTAATAHALAEAAAHDQLHVMEWLWHSLQDNHNKSSNTVHTTPQTAQRTLMAVDAASRVAGGHALACAAAAGAVGALTQLLAWGVDVDDENGAALRAAAAGGHVAAAQLLLASGADPSVQDGSPVRLACEHGHTEMAKLLLSQGADLPPGAHHMLISAASQGQLELLRLLMSVGVNAHASDEAALRGAASGGWVDCCKELLQPPCCADVHANEDEALLWAVDNGHEVVVRLLLQHGASAQGDAGQHMLWCAVSRGRYGIVNALMDEGASLLPEFQQTRQI